MCKQSNNNGGSGEPRKCNWTAISWIILLGNVALIIAAFALVPWLYSKVIENGEAQIFVSRNYHEVIRGNLPADILVTDSIISTRRSLDADDLALLYTLVDKSDTASYVGFQQSINRLAYESNNTSIKAISFLVILTLCFVLLGCFARTLYDFIGKVCYQNDHDMSVWWPWYVFRPIIGAPIAAFILVASRCAMFSTLFTSKDLNTYLVISFIAGFAMMEFLSMLRSTSKGLFDKNGDNPKNAQDAEVNPKVKSDKM